MRTTALIGSAGGVTSPSDAFPATERTTIGRHPERGTDSRAEAYEILDEGLVVHVGMATEAGPVVLPTTYARVGDDLVLHGAPAATWLRALRHGASVCATVTLLDGLVLARSAFHHSMNYRSVVVFGVPEAVLDPEAKRLALDALVEHIVPGRSPEVRPPTEAEVAGTLVVRIPLAEASTKIRRGGPVDDDADLDRADLWAGVLPLVLTAGEPIPAADLRGPAAELPVPASVVGYQRHRT